MPISMIEKIKNKLFPDKEMEEIVKEGDLEMEYNNNTNNRLRPTVYGKTNYYCSENPNCSVRIDLWNGNIVLVFSNRIAQDNRDEMKCYLNGPLVYAIAQATEQMVQLRQQEYMSTGTHSTPFELPITLTKFDSVNGKTIPNGTLLIKTVDNCKKIALEYSKGGKTITVVLYSERIFIDNFTQHEGEIIKKLDLHDTAFINFSVELRDAIRTKLPVLEVTTACFEFFMGPKFRNNNGGAGNPGNNSYNTHNAMESNDFSDFDVTETF